MGRVILLCPRIRLFWTIVRCFRNCRLWSDGLLALCARFYVSPTEYHLASLIHCPYQVPTPEETFASTVYWRGLSRLFSQEQLPLSLSFTIWYAKDSKDYLHIIICSPLFCFALSAFVSTLESELLALNLLTWYSTFSFLFPWLSLCSSSMLLCSME